MAKNNNIIRELVEALKSGACDTLTDEQAEKIINELSISERVDDISNKVDRLFDAICGDTKMGHKGVVKRIDDLEEWRKGIDTIKWKAVGIIGAAGVFSQIIYYFIQKHL